MGLFDFLKPKAKEPVVIKKTTTIFKKNTVVVKKNPIVENKIENPEVKSNNNVNNMETTIENKVNNIDTKVENKNNTEVTTIKTKKQYPGLIVALDPGHAVTTGGKKSPYTLNKIKPELDFYEYKFNREIVNILAKMLKEYGISVFITTDEQRDKNTDVSLTTRASRAWNAIKASGKKGIFISVHANAHGRGNEWTSAKGWSAFTTKANNISDKLADCFYDEATKFYKNNADIKIRTDKSDGDPDWESNFTVIYKTEQFSMKNGKPTVPAVLTENFFYTNIGDCKYLLSEQGKNDIAKLHLLSILSFADKEFKM